MSESHDTTFVDRREFLRLAGASLALAGLDGCTRMPAEHILPYVDSRPELTPGVARHFATAMCVDGIATGLIVEAHEGRPTKVEGNPDHPASLGASGAIEHASVLQLYDPDRATTARIRGGGTRWSAVANMLMAETLGPRVGARGEKLRLLIEPTSSPLDEALLARVLQRYPDAGIHMYAPLVPERVDTPLVRQYDLTAASVIVAIDADVLATGPFHLRYARQFANGRRVERPTDSMNRLYVIESEFTPTGSAADHRFAIRPRDIASIVRGLYDAVANATPSEAAQTTWVTAIGRDLVANAGHAVVIVGDRQPAAVRALGDAINAAIRADAATTWQTPNPLIGSTGHLRRFSELVHALQTNAVDTLVIVGGNPSYTTPGILEFSSLLKRVPNAGYVGLYENETARDVSWFVPMSHYLETWGDARAHDGTLSIVQPLVNPLYESVSPAEIYAAIAGTPATAYDLLRASWTSTETTWSDALRRGVIAGSAYARQKSSVASSREIATHPPAAADSIDVLYSADLKIHDGAFANNGWLQELPSPLTQLAWGNAALISPTTARRFNVSTGDVVDMAAANRRVTIPALIVPGHADDTITVHFGYGRDGTERTAKGVGANAFSLWPTSDTRFESGLSITKTGKRQALTIIQTHSTLETSDPIRRATLAEYRASPSSVGRRSGRVLSLYPDAEPAIAQHVGKEWAMTIDLSTCIGCGACSVACQAENNIPVVGADEARNARSMHWIRIDRYFVEHEGHVDALVQPMLCQHCENAPCEYVCPVEATVHSSEGLNEMVYNRCVGTRFCSNNCPYKVRRFNWYDYNAHLSETERMVKNPNVTVRERGVMEKCTFCVQRIRGAEIAAERDGRELRGSDVVTACQQACPTNAIVFGSLTEPTSEVVRRCNQPRSFTALADLGTEPRVSYLARLRNPNPDIHGSV